MGLAQKFLSCFAVFALMSLVSVPANAANATYQKSPAHAYGSTHNNYHAQGGQYGASHDNYNGKQNYTGGVEYGSTHNHYLSSKQAMDTSAAY